MSNRDVTALLRNGGSVDKKVLRANFVVEREVVACISKTGLTIMRHRSLRRESHYRMRSKKGYGLFSERSVVLRDSLI